MNGSMVSACCATSIPVVSAPSACPSKKTAAGRFRRRAVSCRATGDGDGDGLLWLPRRDVMVNGLSGVAAGLAWYPGLASGEGEDSKSPCKTADKVTDKNLLCTNTPEQAPCPPRLPATPTLDFEPARRVRRVRKAAHLLSKEEQEKYKEAVGRMKALPEWNPLSFAAQAAIHESYCDHYYSYHRQRLFGSSEDDDPPFDVHFSWLFAPWHRMYLYFYERALGQLIGDDTFALPYWNWDHPAGMGVPDIFKRSVLTISTPLSPTIDKNPLYNPNRNPLHENALIDLDYINTKKHGDEVIIPFKGTQDEKYKALVEKNLCIVHHQQLRSGPSAESFLGQKYCTDIGSSKSSQGSLEGMAHTAVHVWVGKAGPTPPATTCTDESGGGIPNHAEGGYTCTNDMGFLGSAGRDPLFYSHHSNIDRLWHLWSTRLGGGEGITDPDWLDTSFVFYDDVHNPRKVRIKFSDVLDTRDLGYTYDPRPLTDLPWLCCKLESLVDDGKDSAPARMRARSRAAAPAPEFPLALTQGQVVVVPDVAVPPMEPGADQVLVIEGIEFDPQENNKFDVAINVPADKAVQVGPQYKEYAGTFAVVPGSGGGRTRRAMLSLCITNVLFDIEADGDSTVSVVIVPRSDAKVTLNVRPTIQNRE